MGHLKYLLTKKRLFFAYFILNILFGAILLSMPFAWNGPERLKIVDALFTSVSAVCVTGLITVDTALYSTFGQIVILYLIEAGGLGIITFSTVFLIFPGSKISLQSRQMIQAYSIDEGQANPMTIVKFVIGYTLFVQLLGFVFLYLSFFFEGDSQPVFNAVFHSISAFCNAGFSRYSDSLMRYQGSIAVNFSVMFLVVFGGIGFMVIWDLLLKAMHQKKGLKYHTRIMLILTPLLIIVGAAIYLILEWNGVFAGMNIKDKLLASLFQSVTNRTAGFNTVALDQMTMGSKMVTLLFMFIGAGSGSTGGGIKVTTFFILLLIVIRGIDQRGRIRIFQRRISSRQNTRASIFFLKAVSILFISVFLLLLTDARLGMMNLVFETFSALGTVGLSLGITSQLSVLGKLVIIITMFAGRVGLFSMIIPETRKDILRYVEYPEGEVLIG